ncbi:MAG: class I SAM-dependent methyltransferase [Actinobacteria bacterium]|nr:class I SAM-dependent methyltransferase [Actinomycetota bacterium]
MSHQAPPPTEHFSDEYAAIAEVYDLWSADMTADVPFYVSEAVATGGPVLEVGVGTGRVSVAMARAGVDVVGIDVSPSMLGRARDRVERERLGDRIELIEADMRGFELDRTFKLAVLPYRVLAHALTPDEQLATLRSIRAHLPPGGRLVFNLPVPRPDDLTSHDGLRREGRYRLDDGHEAVLWRHADYEPGTQRIRFHFVVDHLDAEGRVTDRVHGESLVRQSSPGELEHALARTGFEIVDRWGWFDQRAFGADSPEMVWGAVRTEGWINPGR